MGLLFSASRRIFATTTEEPAIQITPEQDKFIDTLASYYSKLMLSFHPQEIPFDEYYATHSSKVDEFARIMKEIQNDLMTNELISNLNELERYNIFFQKASQYDMDKINSDTTPNTFEVIKLWYYHNKSPKQDDVPKFCTAFEQNKQINEGSIVDALSKFTNKHEFDENRVKYFIELNNKERKQYLKKKDEPDLSIHHVIPLNKLQTFFRNYYKIQEKKEQELMDNHKYNWYKIMNHNQRQLLLNTLKHQHIDYHKYLSGLIDKDSNGEGPSTSEQKLLKRVLRPAHQLQEDSGYSEFMDMMLSLPPGLSFRGPESNIRSDDPNENFEENCAIVLGENYFNKVKILHDQINAFNKQYEENPLLEQNEEESIRIYNRITMIHLEQGSQIIFAYNPAHWIQENGKWRIKTIDEWNALQQAGEFLQKQIAQQQDLDRTRVISISGGVMSGDFVFYKTNRRRRNIINNSLEILKNKCNEHNEIPKLPERHFCYSKPYYMLLPPVYVYCRLYYYK
jgi:hypothetical protein